MGMADPLLDPAVLTGINVNEGIITTGDNSFGMTTAGRNTRVVNTGSITTGNFDISAFLANEFNSAAFAQLRAGASASSWRYTELINYGTITAATARSARSRDRPLPLLASRRMFSRAKTASSRRVTTPSALGSSAISLRPAQRGRDLGRPRFRRRRDDRGHACVYVRRYDGDEISRARCSRPMPASSRPATTRSAFA